MSTIKILDANGDPIYLSGNGAGTISDPFVPTNGNSVVGPQKQMIYRKMDTVGDGSGNTNMAIDGSGGEVMFKIAPPPGTVYRLARWMLYIRDAGTFDSGGWGNNGGVPLTNGIDPHYMNGTISIPMLQSPVKSHGDIASICYDIEKYSWGTGDEFLVARWTFTKAGQFIRLDGDVGEELHVGINDDLTHLVEQSIQVQGYIE